MIRIKSLIWFCTFIIIFFFDTKFALANSRVDTVTTYVCQDYLNTHSGKIISEYPSVLEKKQTNGRSVITWRGRGLNPLKPHDMWTYSGSKVAKVTLSEEKRTDVYIMLGGPPRNGPMAPFEFDWQLEIGYPVIVQEFGANLIMYFVFPDEKRLIETPSIERVTCYFNEKKFSK